jgi:hypothetical protein
MKWLKKLVVKWVREDWDNASQVEETYAVPRLRKSNSSIQGSTLDSDAQLTFTVYNAIGGKVVEFRRYDRKTDRSDHSVYVIGKEEDFGAKIAKIAMLEVIKD